MIVPHVRNTNYSQLISSASRVKVSNEMKMDPTTRSRILKIQTSKGRSFQLASRQTPAFRSALPPNWLDGWPTLIQRLFGFKRETKGEYKAFRIGGVLPKERHYSGNCEWR